MIDNAMTAVVLAASFAVVVDGEWRPGIGDPTFMGWATTVGYFVAAVLCFRAMKRSKASVTLANRKPLFWLLAGFLLVLLGLNKQLDLQTWFTLEGKAVAKMQGWYAQRQLVQGVFIVGITAAGLLFTGGLVWVLWSTPRLYRMATLGLTFLTCFVVIRAASFHHIDQFIGRRIEGVRLNWFLENVGILCVAIPAFSIKKLPTEEQVRSSRNMPRSYTGPKGENKS